MPQHGSVHLHGHRRLESTLYGHNDHQNDELTAAHDRGGEHVNKMKGRQQYCHDN
jgi:hypothetical protein